MNSSRLFKLVVTGLASFGAGVLAGLGYQHREDLTKKANKVIKKIPDFFKHS